MSNLHPIRDKNEYKTTPPVTLNWEQFYINNYTSKPITTKHPCGTLKPETDLLLDPTFGYNQTITETKQVTRFVDWTIDKAGMYTDREIERRVTTEVNRLSKLGVFFRIAQKRYKSCYPVELLEDWSQDALTTYFKLRLELRTNKYAYTGARNEVFHKWLKWIGANTNNYSRYSYPEFTALDEAFDLAEVISENKVQAVLDQCDSVAEKTSVIMIAQGYKQKEVAEFLGMDPRDISRTLKAIGKKIKK